MICDLAGNQVDHAWQSDEFRKGWPLSGRESFSADGRLLTIVTEDEGTPKMIAIVDWRAGQTISSFPMGRSVWGFAMSPDGRLIAMTGCDGPNIDVRDVQSGKLVTTLKMKADDFWDVSFSLDGKLLAVSGSTETEKKKGRQGLTVVWQVPSWEKLKTFIDRESWATTAVTFSPDSKTLACGTTSGTIRFHDSPPVE